MAINSEREAWEKSLERYIAINNAIASVKKQLYDIYIALGSSGSFDNMSFEIPGCAFCEYQLNEYGYRDCNTCPWAKKFGDCNKEEDSSWEKLNRLVMDSGNELREACRLSVKLNRAIEEIIDNLE